VVAPPIFLPMKQQQQMFHKLKTKEERKMTITQMLSLNMLCMESKRRWKGIGQPYKKKRRLKSYIRLIGNHIFIDNFTNDLVN
jgi:hypothetical protein